MRGDPAITVCTCGPWRSDAWEWAAWRKERAEIVGWGTTEHEAMDDLLRKLKEADNERGAALVSDERRRVLMIPQEEWDRRHGIKAADGRANLSSPGSVIPDEAVGKPVAWRWRIIGGDMWVHWGTEPVVGVNLSDETVIGRDVEVQPLYASPTSPPREEDIRVINADHTRLTACLLAMSEAGPNVTAEALRSVAYDAVMNLIPADVAEHQLNARSTSPPRDEIAAVPAEAVDLTFAQLRAANIARLPRFKNRRGEPAHSEPDGSDWKLSAWCNAVLGELGELANLIKKIERGDMLLDDARGDVADELADVQTYLDILAFRCGVDLGEATISKFNRVSDRVGCDVRLPSAPPSPPREEIVEALRSTLTPAIDQLRNHQTQLDMDGIQVGVSRQAIDEVLAGLDAALSRLEGRS